MQIMRFTLAMVLLLFSVIVLAGEVTVIENDALRITFGTPDSGFAISAIENKLVGDTRFVHSTAEVANFWEIVLSSRDVTGGVIKVTLDNRASAVEKKTERVGDETRFIWKGLDIPGGEKTAVDVVARVILPPGNAASEWYLEVQNRSKKWALHDTAYPHLREVVHTGEADVLMPYETLGARLLKNYNGKSRNRICQWGQYDYPSYYAPVAAYMIGDAGLYFAAHDPEVRQKTMFTWDLNAWFKTPVENMGIVGKAAEGPRFPVVIAAFKGDWWQAARRYRDWALQQKWCAKGPISSRTDYPREAMSEISAWTCYHIFDPTHAERVMDRIKKSLPGVKLGFRAYRWGVNEFNSNYPEFFPQRRGVKEVFGRLGAKGWTVMPYVNAQLWDTKLVSWQYAQDDATLRETGGHFTETWGAAGSYPYGRHEYGVMCPIAARWQERLLSFAHRVTEDVCGGAIYYDQAGCSPYRTCVNPIHGHSLGGGSWWADGYRSVFKRVHDAMASKGVAITTEGTADCYMDVLDGLLTVTDDTGEDVPFWPAVYADYTTYFGSRHAMLAEYDLCYLQMARAFIWGVANCWSGEVEDSKNPERLLKFNAFVRFAAAREKAKDFLAYGTLVDELRPLNSLPERTFSHTLFKKSNLTNAVWQTSAVIGSWWRNPSGNIALVAVNITDEAQNIKLVPPSGAQEPIDILMKPREILVHRTDENGRGKNE